MSVKLIYGYLTTINIFQYFLVFNFYRRMNKFEYISENSHTAVSEISHTVVSESCLQYLTIANWFQLSFFWYAMKNLNLLTYNLFSIHLLKEVKDSYIIERMFADMGVKCVRSLKLYRSIWGVSLQSSKREVFSSCLKG